MSRRVEFREIPYLVKPSTETRNRLPNLEKPIPWKLTNNTLRRSQEGGIPEGG